MCPKNGQARHSTNFLSVEFERPAQPLPTQTRISEYRIGVTRTRQTATGVRQGTCSLGVKTERVQPGTFSPPFFLPNSLAHSSKQNTFDRDAFFVTFSFLISFHFC